MVETVRVVDSVVVVAVVDVTVCVVVAGGSSTVVVAVVVVVLVTVGVVAVSVRVVFAVFVEVTGTKDSTSVVHSTLVAYCFTLLLLLGGGLARGIRAPPLTLAAASRARRSLRTGVGAGDVAGYLKFGGMGTVLALAASVVVGAVEYAVIVVSVE